MNGTHVKAKAVVVPQDAMLDVVEAGGPAVDEYEPHAALKRRGRVLTVRGAC